MIDKNLNDLKQALREARLENELLKSKVFILENNNIVLESRISSLMRDKALKTEANALLIRRIIELEQEKDELEQVISEIYDGE